MSAPLVEAAGLGLRLPDLTQPRVFLPRRKIEILRDVDFEIFKGETVGIVGESGSGKTSLGRCMVRLHQPTSGTLSFNGSDITRASQNTLRPLRRRMQMIFQDPQSSLNPRQKIRRILQAPFDLLGSERTSTHISELLDKVGLAPEFAERYPHELSGGQRQRVGIARAIALNPDFVLADEIVSGLDVSTQAQILALLNDLKRDLGLSLAFISHDLSVIRHICDRVYVMKEGEIVEQGQSARIFDAPSSPYTETLIDAIPLPEPDEHWLDWPETGEGTDEESIGNEERESPGMNLSGAVALVSGANRGIGKCFVEELATRGVTKIYAAVRDLDSLKNVKEPSGVSIIPLTLDVTKPSHISAAAKAAGDVTVLINNAGINCMDRLLEASDDDAARREMDTNYHGMVNMCRAFSPVIADNGGGGIVNMLSILGQVNLPVMGSLSASKAAAYSATQAIRAELASKGIDVVAVMPGAVDTDMSKDFSPPKMPPEEVATEALDGLEAGEWEVFPGEMAKGLKAGLSDDPIEIQKQMMASLTGAGSAKSAARKGKYMTVGAADGGQFQAYIARPEKGSGPGLVLLQEIFGINDYMMDMADHFAEEGYVAVVPDLFWRQEEGVNLGYSEEDFQKAFGLYQEFDVDQALKDIQDTITTVRGQRFVKGKVGTIGYCLGGLLAYLSATRTDADVAVGYYAVGVQDYLKEAKKISCPLTLHFAGEDQFCPAEAREAIYKQLEGKDGVSLHLYEGQDHAFATPGRDHFDKPSTLMAYSRSLATLRGVLGPVYDLEHLWDMHCYHEFVTRDVDATMATMVSEPYVNHIPTMTGGVGHDHLKRFYKYHFVDSNPEDTKLIPVSRTIGADRLVDELIFCFTHTCEIDWMLPGIKPTGKYVEVPLVAIVNFRGDKLYHEHIYWDQASVLVQIGKLDETGLPVAGGDTAKKLLDETRPSNALMADNWKTSEGKPI
ncbi:MAG: SDR family NAD(P)-dependent oxidoreductase [Alphaproteobacteria bacterium]|nr:SDR family NAD(P)-dependent oxidoreductase [Alphaproteobacteria bacterium]